MKFLGVYYWYVKMPRCGCVEHGLEYFSFYVQKHILNIFISLLLTITEIHIKHNKNTEVYKSIK